MEMVLCQLDIFVPPVQVSHHIIRVKAPLFTRVCMAVDICIGVTAGDIITKLQKKSRLNQDLIKKRFSSTSLMLESSQSLEMDNANKLKLPDLDAGEQFLFEVGGNIGMLFVHMMGSLQMAANSTILALALAHIPGTWP